VGGAAIRFVASPAGKPRLAPEQAFAPRISFNLSHSGGRALLAISHGPEIGVDLEAHDRKTDVLPLADRYFAVPEREAVASADESSRRTEFFRIWTAKEAVIKAQGEGLGIPLGSFSVAHAQRGADFVRVMSFGDARLDEGWFVRSLACESGWSAALAGRTPLNVRLMGRG
jgi:4'-phosphopantetheinyl transferase